MSRRRRKTKKPPKKSTKVGASVASEKKPIEKHAQADLNEVKAVSEEVSKAVERTSEVQQHTPLRSSFVEGSPRSISVFRRVIPKYAKEENATETFEVRGHCQEHWEEEEVLPRRSPLSSAPFFLWALIGVLFALSVYFFGIGVTPFSDMWKGDLHHRALLIFINVNHRALGVLFASCVTLTAIAIPLTANNYTSKLINLFINSKVNRAMFLLLVVSNAFGLLPLLLIEQGRIPVAEVVLVGLLGFISFMLVIPYAFYVFHFLQPDEIIRHIEKEVMDDLVASKCPKKELDLELYRRRIIQNLKNLSNIALRSVERYDRDTAMLAMEALRHIMHHYFTFKHEMPAQWFRVSRMHFLSLSGEMRKRVEEGKTFLEAEVMEEFSLVLAVTFGKLRDMVRMISRTVRHIGVEANERQLPAVLELTSLYFNTFLRAAISRREPEAVYMIVYHYRRMAEEMLLTNHVRPVKVAFYLSYYGHQAIRSGLVFVANLISFDLAHMTSLAYERDAPSKRDLFQYFLDFDHDSRLLELIGVAKSRIKLAIYLHHLGYEREQQELCVSMMRYDDGLIEASLREIGSVNTPMFWEVTDRHRHNDYISPKLMDSFAHVKDTLHALQSKRQ